MSKRFKRVVELFLLIGLLLLALRELVPWTEVFLPLGGSDFKQCAILVILAVVYVGISEFFSQPRRRPRPRNTLVGSGHALLGRNRDQQRQLAGINHGSEPEIRDIPVFNEIVDGAPKTLVTVDDGSDGVRAVEYVAGKEPGATDGAGTTAAQRTAVSATSK